MKNLAPSQKFGATLLSGLFVVSCIVGWLSPHDLNAQDLTQRLMSPNATHWLGTDQFGRDLLTRVASAIRLSFLLGILCMLSAASMGVAFGVLAAWKGGRFEQSLEVVVNILLALPGLVLVLLLAAIVPGSFVVLYFAISLVQWVEYYRVSRAMTRPLLQSPELQVSQMMGFSNWYLFKRHIWPKLSASIFTMAAFGGGNAILTMASLGFVYVGIQPPLAELGLMSVELFPYYSQAPWALIQPLIAVALLVLGFHLLAGNKNESLASS
ncbi:MAG: ABC transporter permease [Vibrio sp.]